jgi:hypothetical protein
MRRFLLALTFTLGLLISPVATSSSYAVDYGYTVSGAKYINATSLEISGTVTCPEGADYDIYFYDVRQQSGLLLARAEGDAYGTCTGEPQAYTAQITNYYGSVAFRRGKITVESYGYAYWCDEFDCYYTDLGSVSRTLRMR